MEVKGSGGGEKEKNKDTVSFKCRGKVERKREGLTWGEKDVGGSWGGNVVGNKNLWLFGLVWEIYDQMSRMDWIDIVTVVMPLGRHGGHPFDHDW